MFYFVHILLMKACLSSPAPDLDKLFCMVYVGDQNDTYEMFSPSSDNVFPYFEKEQE